MGPGLIGLDLDNTLIDSVRRYEDEKRVASRYGISPKEYESAAEILYQRYSPSAYRFSLLFSIFREQRPNLSPRLLEDLQQLLQGQYFFPDTLPFLRHFTKNDLIIVTQGDPEFQLPKIHAHCLDQYVREIKICHSKSEGLAALSLLPKFFVDDSPKALKEIKRQYPSVFCVRVRQLAPWEKEYPGGIDARCNSLSEVADLILSLTK